MHHPTHVLYLLFNLNNEVDGRRKLRSSIWNYFHDYNVDMPIDKSFLQNIFIADNEKCTRYIVSGNKETFCIFADIELNFYHGQSRLSL